MDPGISRITIKDALGAIADLALPRACVVCGKPLILKERHICTGCLADLPETHYSGMKHNPMADRFNEKIDAPSYCYASSLLIFEGESDYKKIPRALKYLRNFGEGRYFASMLGKRMAASEWFSDVDLVIPVPLHWTRKLSRGYNQAEIIAREVASALGAECRSDILWRRKRTRTQTKLNVNAKGSNVQGAFSLRKKPSDPVRHILIVDDVFTTGATLAACHNTMRAALGDTVRISVASLSYVSGN